MSSTTEVSRERFTVDVRIGALPYCVVPLTHSGKEIYEETPRARFRDEGEARVFADKLNGPEANGWLIEWDGGWATRDTEQEAHDHVTELCADSEDSGYTVDDFTVRPNVPEPLTGDPVAAIRYLQHWLESEETDGEDGGDGGDAIVEALKIAGSEAGDAR